MTATPDENETGNTPRTTAGSGNGHVTKSTTEGSGDVPANRIIEGLEDALRTASCEHPEMRATASMGERVRLECPTCGARFTGWRDAPSSQGQAE